MSPPDTPFRTAEQAAMALLLGSATLGDGETVSFDASVATAAIGTAGVLAPGWYRLSATEDCWWKLGATPTAVAGEDGSAFLKAGAIDFVYVPSNGSSYKLAAIKASGGSAGDLSVQEYRVLG